MINLLDRLSDCLHAAGQVLALREAVCIEADISYVTAEPPRQAWQNEGLGMSRLGMSQNAEGC
ncbi:hypothetical protein [Methylobacterium isbiliense]|uniref:hypothetical protein n=1 Tax=Methylobacterium isbiliense TaxID=315478 RepID=UPI001EE233BD|nr:hypothetical protein [Methylobacterium isbiliense]MDN3627223.1 hypothetical protein [Methylobacterium isbiliense]